MMNASFFKNGDSLVELKIIFPLPSSTSQSAALEMQRHATAIAGQIAMERAEGLHPYFEGVFMGGGYGYHIGVKGQLQGYPTLIFCGILRKLERRSSLDKSILENIWHLVKEVWDALQLTEHVTIMYGENVSTVNPNQPWWK